MGGERASGTDAGGARRCLALTLLAFLARAGFVVFVGAPTWDEAGIAYGSELGHIARNLAEGRGFSSPFEEGSTPTAWIAPAVPALWALVFRALGTFSDASLTAILALQCLASALAVGIYGSLARRMALASGGSRRVALVLGVALALWPESILGLRRPWYFGFQELGVALLVWRAVQGGEGYLGMNSLPLELGVGDARSVDLEITWPGGEVQWVRGLEPGRAVRIEQGSDSATELWTFRAR